MKTLGFTVIWLVLTGGVIAAAFMSGRKDGAERDPRRVVGRMPGGARLVVFALALTAVVVTPVLVASAADDRMASGAGTFTQPTSEQLRDGREIFRGTCAACHTLSAAGAQGAYGPNLDALGGLKGTPARIEGAIENGGATGKLMPKSLLEGSDAKIVSKYIAAVAAK